jgi:hypothetical protein
MTPLSEFSAGGTITEDGRLTLTSQHAFKLGCKAMSPGPVTVRVKRASRKRTLDQNSFWWAVPVKLLAEHCGYTDTQMHYALLGECFGYTAGPIGGQPVPVKSSSSDLTVEEFTHLIDWVLTWAPTELGVTIPSPNEWEAA